MDSSLLESMPDPSEATVPQEVADSVTTTSVATGLVAAGLGQAASAFRSLLMTVAVASAAVSSFRVAPAPSDSPASIPRESLRFATVFQGTFSQSRQLTGKIRESETAWIKTEFGGEVVAVMAQPGDRVEKGAVLVQLHDRAAERAVVEAQRGVRSAEASRERLQLEIAQQQTDLANSIAQSKLAHEEASKAALSDEALFKRGFRSEERYRNAVQRRRRTWNQFEALIQRSSTNSRVRALSLQEKEDQLARANERLADCQQRVDALTIRATTTGLIQHMGNPKISFGQKLSAGTVVAKIVQTAERLEADFEIAMEDATQFLVGQRTSVCGQGMHIPGRVTSISASPNGGCQLTVDLTPDQTEAASCAALWPGTPVTATMQSVNRPDALQVVVPDGAKPNTSANLFRMAQPNQAVRVPVNLGCQSNGTIVVTSGLNVGDEIIISNCSQWAERYRLDIE